MTLKYLGHASFSIKTREGKLVTDPYDAGTGLKFPKVEADIITISHQHSDHNQASLVGGQPTVFDMPGEYEKQGFRLTGFNYYHDKSKGKERGENILFKIEAEGVSVLHCGDLGCDLTDEFAEEIGNVDVLLIPVGGFYTIDKKEALEIAKKLEPSIVIPMHYKTPQHNVQIFEKLETLEDFLKEAGVSEIETQKEFAVKQEDLEGEMKVIVLETSS